jgi:predicted DNA-binding transcriptional regulator AlpA
VSSQEDLLDLDDICSILGLSYSTGLRWKKTGKLPAPSIFISRRVQRWRRSELDRFLAAHERNLQDAFPEPVPPPWDEISPLAK